MSFDCLISLIATLELELPTNNQRKYGQGSKHAVEQERLVQDELMETYFNERDIPPNPRQQLRFDESTTQPSRFPLTEVRLLLPLSAFLFFLGAIAPYS